MNRFFNILAAVSIAMVLIAGGGTYWVTLYDVNKAHKQSIEGIAKGISVSISSQVHILQQTVSNMAAIPEVIAATESNDPELMEKTAIILEQFLPGVMKIRILQASVSELDTSSVPHMGNADLMMVQETLKKPQAPFIQGSKNNRHLAITAVIQKENKPIGVVLASLNFGFLQSSFKIQKINSGLINLKQGNISLAKTGDLLDNDDSFSTINVAKTQWKINYKSTKTTSLTTLSTFAGLVFIPVLIIGLAFFVNYRNLTYLIRQDQGNILRAAKDLLAGRTVGSYPINLDEMKTIISTIVQFKRMLNNEENELTPKLNDDPELDDLFDEPMGVELLEDEPVAKNTKFESFASSPISLPQSVSKPSPEPSVFALNTWPETVEIEIDEESSEPFGVYDVRGVVGKTLTKEIVFDIGRAVGSNAKEKDIKTIIVGMDGRTSSPLLAESLAKGIISTGVNVLDIGLVPSPVVYFVVQHTEGKSGIVITGSHNPIDYNGLKIIVNGESLVGDGIKQLKQRINDKNYLTGKEGSIEKNSMFVNEYIGIISDDIRIARPMKIVVDCGNGAAGELAPILFKTLGCEVIEIFCEIDGSFPNHHPDPSIPENLNHLTAAVLDHQADIGIAVDGSGNRLGIIDCKGKIIWPDRLMMLFAKHVLDAKPGAEVIYDVKCSTRLGEQIVKYGGRPLMSKTGYSFIKAKLKETGAVLAGEYSGHIFFNDRWFGFDDALYSASRLIEILSADSRNSDEVFADFPENVSTPEIKIELAEGENQFLMKKICNAAHFEDGKIIDIDGLRVEFDDGWGLVRASNTMPSLVLRFEGDNNEALKRIQSQFKLLFTEVKPSLNLPF